MTQPIVALVEDLVFTAKLRLAAQATETTLHVATQAEEFLQLIRGTPPRLILLDLNFSRADALALVTQVRELANGHKTPIIGFLSHVQTERAQQAVSAGCAAALPRSLFVQQLPALLREGVAALRAADPSAETIAPQADASAAP